MRKILAIFLIFALALCIASEDNRRIAGGVQASKGDFPWHVKLVSFSTGGAIRVCGGALIKYNWVLTAASCVYDSIETLAWLGSVQIFGLDHEYSFYINNREYIRYRRDFNLPIGYANDIALLYLADSSESVLDNPYVATIPLPYPDDDYIYDRFGFTSGFGQVNATSGLSSNLLFTAMTIYPTVDCESVDFDGRQLSVDKFCTNTNLGRSQSPLKSYR
jgi:Trypsin